MGGDELSTGAPPAPPKIFVKPPGAGACAGGAGGELAPKFGATLPGCGLGCVSGELLNSCVNAPGALADAEGSAKTASGGFGLCAGEALLKSWVKLPADCGAAGVKLGAGGAKLGSAEGFLAWLPNTDVNEPAAAACGAEPNCASGIGAEANGSDGVEAGAELTWANMEVKLPGACECPGGAAGAGSAGASGADSGSSAGAVLLLRNIAVNDPGAAGAGDGELIVGSGLCVA